MFDCKYYEDWKTNDMDICQHYVGKVCRSKEAQEATGQFNCPTEGKERLDDFGTVSNNKMRAFNRRMMMNPNYDKLNFSRTMTDQEGGFITSDVCHNYGIMSGCDEGCPALLSGDCDNIKDAIKCCDVDEQERTEILALYKEG